MATMVTRTPLLRYTYIACLVFLLCVLPPFPFSSLANIKNKGLANFETSDRCRYSPKLISKYQTTPDKGLNEIHQLRLIRVQFFK